MLTNAEIYGYFVVVIAVVVVLYRHMTSFGTNRTYALDMCPYPEKYCATLFRHWVHLISLKHSSIHHLVGEAQHFTGLGPQWEEYYRHACHMLSFEAWMLSLTATPHGSTSIFKFILLSNLLIVKVRF